MPTICSALNANLNADCNAKPVGGAEALQWIIPREDWSAAARVTDITNPLILRSVILPPGKKSFEFLVFKHGHKPRFQNKDSEYGTYFLHEIVTSIQIYNNAVKAQIQALADNYYVIISENVNKTGDAVFEVYGTGYGLRVQDGAIRDLAANEGVYTCVFANDANYHEPTPPLSFCVLDATGNFSYTLTKAAILALAGPPIVIPIPINLAAVITLQPAGTVSITIGATLTLSVTATDAKSYQWFKGSTAIVGATGATFTKASAVAADSGPYNVVVTGNDNSTVTSTNSTVTVQ